MDVSGTDTFSMDELKSDSKSDIETASDTSTSAQVSIRMLCGCGQESLFGRAMRNKQSKLYQACFRRRRLSFPESQMFPSSLKSPSLPRRSDSLNATQQKSSIQPIFLTIEQELHDARRVQTHGQEDDLRGALGMVINRVSELVCFLPVSRFRSCLNVLGCSRG